MSRAVRRHHKSRMKDRAKYIYGTVYGFAKAPYEWNSDRHHRLGDNITVCSGPCCGNPRKWFGKLTRQEKRFGGDE